MNKKTFGLLVVICLVHFLLGFDINIVSISLSSISQFFNTSPDITSRIVWLYFLILTCFLQIFGRLADIKGFKNLYIAGIFIFSFSSFLCGISSNFLQLTLFRCLQAIGSAILFGLTPALISEYFSEDIKGKIFGINYSFVALGGVLGRFVSGILIENYSWKSIFFVNLPLGFIALIVGIIFIPKIILRITEYKFDFIGSFLIFVALFGLLYFLNIINNTEFFSVNVIISLLLFIIFLPLFILRELRIPFPLLNLRLLKNPDLTKHLLIFLIIYIYTNGMIFISPFFLQKVYGYSITTTGFLMTITSVAQVFSGYFSGHLADKINSKFIILTGLILTFISLILFSFLNTESNINVIIVILSIYGISVGLSIPANTNAVMKYAPQFQKGSVSGFMITIIRTGSALGICLYGILYSVFLIKNIQYTDLSIKGFKYIFLIGGLISMVGIVISFLLETNKQKNNIS